jgi:hypothetical protein
MPISKQPDGWYWGSKGPFDTKQKAIQVGQAAHASGFKEAEMDNKAIGTFVSTLLHSATITHLMHFKSKSYSEHVALAAYYDEIPELVDGLVESIQGAYETIIEPYPSMFGTGDAGALPYMVSLRNYVRDYREQMPQDSEIQNEIDNIATLLNQTVYKLKFLK